MSTAISPARAPRGPGGSAPPEPEADRTAPSSAAKIISHTLALICAAALLWVASVGAISQVQEYFAQDSLYGHLRLTLAQDATPVGPLTKAGTPVPSGTPVAVMNAPTAGVGRAVIVQGSGGAQTMVGIGHVPDTVMPCQSGTAALMARNGAYGGLTLGDRWASLVVGDEFTITMGQGTCTYRVTDQRLAGQLAPPAPTGTGGSIVLITAEGRPFMPTGVLRIDATLIGNAYTPPSATAEAEATPLPSAENPMGIDTSHLFIVILLLQVFLAAAIATAWAWNRWGRRETWLVATPVLLTFALLVADNLNLLLPNLL